MMVENIKGCGKMENNMAKENFIIQRTKFGKRVYGTMEKGLNGIIVPLRVKRIP